MWKTQNRIYGTQTLLSLDVSDPTLVAFFHLRSVVDIFMIHSICKISDILMNVNIGIILFSFDLFQF